LGAPRAVFFQWNQAKCQIRVTFFLCGVSSGQTGCFFRGRFTSRVSPWGVGGDRVFFFVLLGFCCFGSPHGGAEGAYVIGRVFLTFPECGGGETGGPQQVGPGPAFSRGVERQVRGGGRIFFPNRFAGAFPAGGNRGKKTFFPKDVSRPWSGDCVVNFFSLFENLC